MRKTVVWMLLLLLLLLLLLFVGCSLTKSFSKKSSTMITGIVVDEKNNPVNGAEVRTDPFTEITYSNKDGQFTIRQDVIPEKFYTVIAELTAVKPIRSAHQKIMVQPKRDNFITIVLSAKNDSDAVGPSGPKNSGKEERPPDSPGNQATPGTD